MSNKGNYIKRIQIDALWSRRRGIDWTLRPDVNILSGVNGVGKSTILNKLVSALRDMPASGEIKGATHLGVRIDFSPSDATGIRYYIIRSFDRQPVRDERITAAAGVPLITELDCQLYLVQRRYLDYQVNVGNRMIALLTGGAPDARERATEAANLKTRFQDIVDELFSETGKRIDRQSNELSFIQYDEPLSPYKLSSGEKQVLLILLTVLTEDRQPYVLFMDEPEVSMHVEWQKQLIDLILQLNPNVQIILTTHSPAVIMNGWMDRVTEVSDIIVNNG